MVAVDSNFLPLLLSHETKPPDDPSTKKPIEFLEERIDLLIETLEEDNETIVIPTPVLSEFLVLTDKDGPTYLRQIEKSPLYRVAPFDQLAAIELAAMRLEKLRTLSKRAIQRQSPQETKAKISFDRQIVAIAKVNHAHTIYSDDGGVGNFATEYGIRVVRTWELPLPTGKQMTFEELQHEKQELESGGAEIQVSGSTRFEREATFEADEEGGPERTSKEPTGDG